MTHVCELLWLWKGAQTGSQQCYTDITEQKRNSDFDSDNNDDDHDHDDKENNNDDDV